MCDPSRSVILDLQAASERRMDSTVEPVFLGPLKSLDDDVQVQCLPVCKAKDPRWMYRGRCRRLPRPETSVEFQCGVGSHSHLCISCALKMSPKELLSQLCLCSHPSHLREEGGVSCGPVRAGSPKLVPCCLCNNWRHVPCSYQTHLGRICPCHIRILDRQRKIMVTSHPYMEDYVVLPNSPTIRMDERMICHDVSCKLSHNDQTKSRWC